MENFFNDSLMMKSKKRYSFLRNSYKVLLQEKSMVSILKILESITFSHRSCLIVANT